VNFTTEWLKPTPQIKGQDPLGVRAPCENIYSQLLPGITNVTDRADLYAFYPWLIWALERHEGPLKKKPFFETLRRAECLQTLIGNWHTNHTDEASWRHGAGLVGRDKLTPALAHLQAGKSIRLSTYATLDEETGTRYFKNKLGGLGQYYLGSLRDLGIIEGDVREIKYVTERGGILAESFEKKINRRLFFETLEKDRISLEGVKGLRQFCPCYLTKNEVKRDALVDLFFNRPSAFFDVGNDSRRDSLFLLLNLTSQLEADNNPATSPRNLVDLFRGCTYSVALPSGAIWKIPTLLKTNHDGWQKYLRNELLSIAIQSFFWGGLQELLTQGIQLQTSEHYAIWFTSTFENALLSRDLDQPFGEALNKRKFDLPELAAWNEERHEVQFGWMLNDIQNSFEPVNATNAVVVTSTDLLLTLAARLESTQSSYLGFVHSQNYLRYYPINLDTFSENALTHWQNLSMRKVLAGIATEWGVNAHFQVALRKLRYESRDTFKIKPTEQGLEVVEAPPPGFSNPRLMQCIQILLDLGMFEFEADLLLISDAGRNMLRGIGD
jgi:hypothetical protein